MKLIQIFLPVYGNDGHAYPQSYFGGIRTFLLEKYGGVTFYSQAPATGLWKEDEKHAVKDQIIIMEVMTESIDIEFWQAYKHQLEGLLVQDTIIIRSMDIQLI